jgi:predicted protein tyrosine phosphatase
MCHVLFVCSQNRLRSPTAEHVFSSWPGIEVASAGLDDDAVRTLTTELVAWADVIFVMEKAHRSKLSRNFKAHLKSQRVVCLNIPDDYDYMDPILVRLLKALVPRYLPKGAKDWSPAPIDAG